MRLIKQIPHPEFGITLFSWNQKYILKLEYANLEQTYKFSEMDILQIEEIDAFIQNEEFIKHIQQRFESMQEDVQALINSF